MHCSICFSSEGKLQMFQGDIDNDTFKTIKFVLPDLSIPKSQDPVFICATCLEQVSFFYTIKKESLQNCTRLKYFNAMLKGTNNIKCKEILVKINSDEVAPQPIEHVEIKVDPYSIVYLLSTEEQEKHIKKDEGSSSSSNNSTQKHKNTPVDKFSTEDSTSKSNNIPYKDQPKTQPEYQKKKFKCSDCHKTFTHRSLLDRHTRVHTGERPYKCTTCQKTFTQLSTLNTHNLTHTSEKPHECDVCHKTFNNKSNLMTHKRVHNNVRTYKCAVCSKAFIQSGNLSAHMRTHRGEKPHQCHLCEYKCLRAGDLKKHILVHTGDKPYSCKHCEKSFTTPSNLSKHKHTFHSNEDPD